ncbi:hypothetical protein L3556_02025 [Candidatus Synechococcus calcipolaris G9]|uniref:Cell division protein FtsL n=1 Tax=Candidatus Synechococcus calcipolaris G9 TaxID=1497997 RepID=A0ABT6EV71_9SYNE|nr:hypothetical protein [Candidatus Synechococcus calcipolaris]MDG2989717.1 hypothetical protein [Candidatus Synechococcus calcipolaris G9]
MVAVAPAKYPPQVYSPPSAPLRKTKPSHLTEIRPLSSSDTPLWLKSLGVLKWGTGLGSVAILASLLPLYGWSALCQYQWGQSYRQLEQLKQQERELLAAQQSQRYQVAEQIERQPQGLVRQGPQQVVFIPEKPATLGASATVTLAQVAPAPKRAVSY